MLCRETEFTKIQQTVSDELNIMGFLDIGDIASPQIVSRHLVLPSSQRKEKSADGEISYSSLDMKCEICVLWNVWT